MALARCNGVAWNRSAIDEDEDKDKDEDEEEDKDKETGRTALAYINKRLFIYLLSRLAVDELLITLLASKTPNLLIKWEKATLLLLMLLLILLIKLYCYSDWFCIV